MSYDSRRNRETPVVALFAWPADRRNAQATVTIKDAAAERRATLAGRDSPRASPSCRAPIAASRTCMSSSPPTTEQHDFELSDGHRSVACRRVRCSCSIPAARPTSEILYTSDDVKAVKKSDGNRSTSFRTRRSSRISRARSPTSATCASRRCASSRWPPTSATGWGDGTQGRLLQLSALHESQRAVESPHGVPDPAEGSVARSGAARLRRTSSTACA